MALRQVQMAASKRFISLSRFLLLLTLIAQLVAGEPLVCSSVVIDASGQLKVVPGWQPGAVAWANLTDQIQENGWAFLQLESNADFNDSLQAYAAGVAEAAVTNKLMYMHWMNTLVGYCGPYKYQTQYCEKLKSYIQENVAWMQEQMESGQDPEYWHQVHLALLQLKGLEDSYDGLVSFPTGNFSLNPVGFLLFQLGGDLEDLESALNKTNPTRVKGSGSCSALIKLLPGNKDLLVSHDTWNTYQSMLRIVKMYSLPFRTTQEESTIIPGSIQSFSSYPGTIFSGDDFYTLSSGLVTLETTIGNSNPALWKFVQPKGTVFEWLRNIVANRLAKNGAEWASIFTKFNSGTYNNQWMIVDYNLFLPEDPTIKPGLLTVLEQIPYFQDLSGAGLPFHRGLVISADKSQELSKEGYWASYNIPYFVDIFNASGGPDLVKQYGDWFSYDKSPRAQIFRRNQTMVHNMESMIRLMRYNNFYEDPLSRCEGCDPPQNGENAISARSDLNPANGTYPFAALRQRQHGGTDMKLTSFQMAKVFGMVVLGGPTWDDVPPFQWSTSPFSQLLHMGHPDRWQFNPVEVLWWQ